MVRGAWQATVHGVAKESDTTQQLNNSNNTEAEWWLPGDKDVGEEERCFLRGNLKTGR